MGKELKVIHVTTHVALRARRPTSSRASAC